jgi:hypothetical protein
MEGFPLSGLLWQDDEGSPKAHSRRNPKQIVRSLADQRTPETTTASAAKDESDNPPQGARHLSGFADRRKSGQAAGRRRGCTWGRIEGMDDRRRVVAIEME